VKADGGDKAKSDTTSNQIARNHELLTVESVKKNACHGPDQDCWDCARQHERCDRGPISCLFDRQTQYGNVVEVISNFTDYLPEPSVPIVAVTEKELSEPSH
jgi:hypothetical protein